MSEVVNHVAGELVDQVQLCTRCGEVISDYRNLERPSWKSPPKGFPPGPITKIGSLTVTGTSEDGTRCKPKEPDHV
jgi:hypothetical protein